MSTFDYMKINLKISGYLALTPHYNIKQQKFVRYIVHSYSVSIFLIASTIYYQYISIFNNTWRAFLLPYALFDIAAAFIVLRMYHSRHLEQVQRDFVEFDCFAQSTGLASVEPRCTTTFLVALLVIANSWLIFMLYLNNPASIDRLHFFRTSFFLVGVSLPSDIMNGLLCRLEILFNYLDRFEIGLQGRVDIVLSLHNSACTILQDINRFFGLNILVYIVATFVLLLKNVKMLLWSTNVTESARTVTYLLMIQVWVLYMITRGEKIKRKFEDVARKACNVANNLVKIDLLQAMFLVQQTSSGPTNVTALGFFEVDHTTIFLAMNLTVTYVIAIIQMIQKTKKKRERK